jgi:hypothetical protein
MSLLYFASGAKMGDGAKSLPAATGVHCVITAPCGK